MKKIIKITEHVCEGIICLGIVCLLAIYLLDFVGIRTFIVRSGSMEPAIWTGSLCFVDTRIEYDDIQVNDIVAFQRGNLLVTHRVIKISEEGFVTKGDNNDVIDGTITTKDNFIGKNFFSVRWMGYIVGWLQTKQGKMTAFAYVASFVIVQGILSCLKEKDKINAINTKK